MNRVDLTEILSKELYDHAVLCTYTFEPGFFETYCLEKFKCFLNNGNITVILDQGIYEGFISKPDVGRPRLANLRYLLHPISVTGVFHPKIFLFTKKNKGKLLIGSANFTEQGLTNNAEMVGSYDFDLEKDSAFKALFQQVFRFINLISQRYPSKTLTSNLQAMFRDSPWLNYEEGLNSHIELIHNLDIPILDQIVSKVSPPVDNVYILSRYFDAQPFLLDHLQKQLQPQRINVFTQNGTTTLTGTWLDHPLVKSKTAQINICEFQDDEHRQPLHAKAIAIEKDSHCLFAFGSANFTSPALLKTAAQGNAEMLLAMQYARNEFKPEDLFDPDHTGFQLIDASFLKTSSEKEEVDYSRHELVLLEALLHEKEIDIVTVIPNKYDGLHLSGKLTFQDLSTKSFALTFKREGSYILSVPDSILIELNKSSTVIQMEVLGSQGEVISRSNPILVTNLLDIRSGKNLRKERHIKEAQQSASQFYDVLLDLLRWGNDSEIIAFLNLCDIPVLDALRPSQANRFRVNWDVPNGMHDLGERNLHIFLTVDKAAIFFIEKHLKKLKQHIDHGGLNGIANFMHIYLAVAEIIASQIERLLQGLGVKRGDLTSHEWFIYREKITIYFYKYQELLKSLSVKYIPTMLTNYSANDVRSRLEPDYPQVREMHSQIMSYKPRLGSLRGKNLRVRNSLGQVVKPGYFNCLLEDKQWGIFIQDIQKMFMVLENTFESKTSNRVQSK